MDLVHKLPMPIPDYESAKRRYVEHYGSILVMNTYLKIAVVLLAVLSLSLVALVFRTTRALQEVKPLVIRINDVGRAEAVRYDPLDYEPHEAELKYFLIEFANRHFSRMRATLRENYAKSLYFLDGRLAEAVMEANKKDKTIENFLSGAGDEVEVKVHNVAIEDLRSPPYKARIDFERVYYSAATRQESRRERVVAHVVFTKKDVVPNELIPINPLGLTITYLRADQAFEKEP